jgi:hypothetical protein
MPNGAEFQRAPNAERRQMPNGAKCRRAPKFRGRNDRLRQRARPPLSPSAVAVFGISRLSEFSAVWNSAPLAFRALTRSFGRR